MSHVDISLYQIEIYQSGERQKVIWSVLIPHLLFFPSGFRALSGLLDLPQNGRYLSATVVVVPAAWGMCVVLSSPGCTCDSLASLSQFYSNVIPSGGLC